LLLFVGLHRRGSRQRIILPPKKMETTRMRRIVGSCKPSMV
jgi:hypothetical protein